MKGYIKNLVPNNNGDITFGFICGEDNEDYFFHKSSLVNCSINNIDVRDDVDFKIAHTERGVQAVNVRKTFQSALAEEEVSNGIHSDFEFEHFYDDEQEIIEFFGQEFLVTHSGKSFNISGSRFNYFLIKPTKHYKTLFNLQREIVVIFSDYTSLEPRSLDAADYVYNKIESKLRLERGCYVLVSLDPNTESKLVSITKDTNYNQIVVPFTYNELLSRKVTTKLIKDRFKKYLFDRDLFDESNAIREDIFFFGRRDYVADIVNKCEKAVHCGIFGLRRSGKTSTLYAIERMLRQQDYPTVFIPCEKDFRTHDWKGALWSLVISVYEELGIDSRGILETEYLANATSYFEEDMNIALEGLSVPLTIMFDEIEAIAFGVPDSNGERGLWTDGTNCDYFWSTIKGYYSKYPKKICVLIAGTNPSLNEAPTITPNGADNPMFRQLSSSNQGSYLPAFSVEETRTMVNTLGGYMGIEFDDYSVGQLTNDCGGHPYLMRMLCSSIYKYVREKRNDNSEKKYVVSKPTYEIVSEQFKKSNEADSFFLMILNILTKQYPQEFETLKMLALEGDKVVSKIKDTSSLSHLIGYGLVQEEHDHYAIKYNFITSYLRGEYKFERQNISIEDQKEEISLRMSDAENRLRNTIRRILRYSYGEESAKIIVLNSMYKNKSASDDAFYAEGLSYKQLFDPSINSGIYFSVLKDIIVDNSEKFSTISGFEDIDVVKKNLNILNKARRVPSHSFDERAERWSWEDFAEFRESMSWLEEVLDDID